LGRDFSWLDFEAFIHFSPPTSQLAMAVNGEMWERSDFLLAALVDSVRAGNWQRGGGKGPKPKPIETPGAKANASQNYGKAVDLNSVRDWLLFRNGRAPEV
jgi:hypothetical protein